MIRITYNEIIERIKEKTGYSEETINDLIQKKVKQLSGLITKEGAAHIVANELGIKLFDRISGKLKIKNILLGMRNVETVGVVKQNFGVRNFNTNNRQGKVGSLIIADETGTIRVVFWNGIADVVNKIKVGDIIKIMAGYVRGNDDSKEIHLNEKSKVIINPPDEKINLEEVQLQQNYERKRIEELKENDRNVELKLVIVQVFEPRFYEVCPECGKKLILGEGGFICETHGKVTPKQAYVINMLGDDGTSTIRLVFFREQMLKILGKKEEDLLLYKEKPESFEDERRRLLGMEIIVRGRVSLNKMFGRTELIVDDVEEVDYDEEIKKVKEEINKLPDEVKNLDINELEEKEIKKKELLNKAEDKTEEAETKVEESTTPTEQTISSDNKEDKKEGESNKNDKNKDDNEDEELDLDDLEF